jgi:hypothetical protein
MVPGGRWIDIRGDRWQEGPSTGEGAGVRVWGARGESIGKEGALKSPFFRLQKSDAHALLPPPWRRP